MQTFSQFSTKQQLEVKKEVGKLLSEGLGYKKIRRYFGEQGIKLSLGTLSYWCNTETKRLRNNSFTAKPSKELAYFIGVMFGDGSATTDQKNQDYSLQLSSIDKEFVEKFSFCVSKLLGKEKNYPVHKLKSIFGTNIRSKELYQFVKEIKNDFEKAKPFIEAEPAEFIQGLADSEGCPKISASNIFLIGVCVANSTNMPLLIYTKELLVKFGINSNINLNHKSGEQDSIIEGRLITRTKNVYALNIQNFRGTKEFFKKIGFSILRKQGKLEDAIEIYERFTKNNQLEEWKRRYNKQKNKRWKRLCSWSASSGI